MMLSRRLLNLIGSLVVLGALLAGTVLIALPVYVESFELRNEEARIAASNQLLASQIAGLQTQEAELPAIEKELARLARQVAVRPQLDDVTGLVVNAAREVGAEVESVDFGEPGAFVPRSTETVVAGLPQTAVEVRRALGGNGEAAPAETTGEADAANSTELQFPVTIVVSTKDAGGAIRFLDEIRRGPRLIQITTAIAATDTADSKDQVTLTVTGFVFVRING